MWVFLSRFCSHDKVLERWRTKRLACRRKKGRNSSKQSGTSSHGRVHSRRRRSIRASVRVWWWSESASASAGPSRGGSSRCCRRKTKFACLRDFASLVSAPQLMRTHTQKPVATCRRSVWLDARWQDVALPPPKNHPWAASLGAMNRTKVRAFALCELTQNAAARALGSPARGV